MALAKIEELEEEAQGLKKSYDLSRKLTKEKRDGKCMWLVGAVMAFLMVCGMGGVAITKNGGMAIVIKEPKVVDCPGGDGKCEEVAIIAPWTELTGSWVNVAEVVSVVEEGSGEKGECVNTTHGPDCNVELCPDHGTVDCFDISAWMTAEEVRRYVLHTCNDDKDGCEMHIGRHSKLIFTPDECNRICKLV